MQDVLQVYEWKIKLPSGSCILWMWANEAARGRNSHTKTKIMSSGETQVRCNKKKKQIFFHVGSGMLSGDTQNTLMLNSFSLHGTCWLLFYEPCTLSLDCRSFGGVPGDVPVFTATRRTSNSSLWIGHWGLQDPHTGATILVMQVRIITKVIIDCWEQRQCTWVCKDKPLV